MKSTKIEALVSLWGRIETNALKRDGQERLTRIPAVPAESTAALPSPFIGMVKFPVCATGGKYWISSLSLDWWGKKKRTSYKRALFSESLSVFPITFYHVQEEHADDMKKCTMLLFYAWRRFIHKLNPHISCKSLKDLSIETCFLQLDRHDETFMLCITLKVLFRWMSAHPRLSPDRAPVLSD